MNFLENLGFLDVRFVHPYIHAHDIDLPELLSRGRIHEEGLKQLQWAAKDNWPLSLSVILNHVTAIAQGLDSGSPVFAVVEDDLMLATAPDAARARLLAAAAELVGT